MHNSDEYNSQLYNQFYHLNSLNEIGNNKRNYNFNSCNKKFHHIYHYSNKNNNSQEEKENIYQIILRSHDFLSTSSDDSYKLQNNNMKLYSSLNSSTIITKRSKINCQHMNLNNYFDLFKLSLFNPYKRNNINRQI